MVRRYVRVPDGNTNKNGEPSIGRPIGVAIADFDSDGNIALGFSLCNENDTFDRILGNQIAEGRMNAGHFWFTPEEIGTKNPIDVVRAHYQNIHGKLSFDRMAYEMEWVVRETLRRANIRTRS